MGFLCPLANHVHGQHTALGFPSVSLTSLQPASSSVYQSPFLSSHITLYLACLNYFLTGPSVFNIWTLQARISRVSTVGCSSVQLTNRPVLPLAQRPLLWLYKLVMTQYHLLVFPGSSLDMASFPFLSLALLCPPPPRSLFCFSQSRLSLISHSPHVICQVSAQTGHVIGETCSHPLPPLLCTIL